MSSAFAADEPAVILSALAGVSVAKYLFGALIRRKYYQGYRFVGRVSSLHVYPIKSCSGYSVERAECTKLGLKDSGLVDRHFLVVKPNGNFVHQREHPKMALIKVLPVGSTLEISAPGMPSIKIAKDGGPDGSKVKSCRVWGCPLEGVDCGYEAGDWFSTYLDVPDLSLLCSRPGLLLRDLASPTDNVFSADAREGDQAAFSDMASYLVTSENSLAVLNEKLEKPVTMTHFRPNVVLNIEEGFQEDNWLEIKIGDKMRMRTLHLCARCTMTTVDPNTGYKSSDGEPLKTLKSFRLLPKYGESPCFGVNAAVDVPGHINVGDPVYAIERLRPSN